MTSSPTIGLIGSEGSYGRWLRRFFETRMGLAVLGSDPDKPGTVEPEELIARCRVLVFCAPIRHTPAIIADYVKRAGGRERGALWLDVTSIKETPVAAMLVSQAEVVGLHPMTAAPKAPTLKGRVMVVCEARLDVWRGWLAGFLGALRAQCVRATPEQHDRIMALVQAMVHATHLAQGGVLGEYADRLGGLEALLPFRSASFELDTAMLSRILAMNPAIYEDIQFCNPYARPMLGALVRQIEGLRRLVERGDDAARADFRRRFFTDA
ncbi:MAG TPA: prephenate dehydrogenase, partial [Chiayiivirga sp.]|nr:prephenate dehydrogenase [Chiayiivirga sp.]